MTPLSLSVTAICITCIVFAVASAVLCLWHFYRQYLIKSLKARFFNGSFILFKDRSIVKTIRDGANSEKSEVASYYLRIAEDTAIKGWQDFLTDALNNPDDNIKDYAIKRIAELRIGKAAPFLFKLAKDSRQNLKIRNMAAFAYTLMSDKCEILQNLKNLVNTDISEGVISAFLTKGDKDLLFIGMQRLSEMINADDENIRAAAVKIIGIAGTKTNDFVYPLTLLAYDESIKVKKEIIATLSRMKLPLMSDFLIKRLAEADCKRSAFSALVNIGKDVIPALKNEIMKGEAKTSILLYMVEIISQIKGLDAKTALMECLTKTSNRRVKDAILKSLTTRLLTIEKSYIPLINQLINKETKNIIFLLSSLVDIGKDEKIMSSSFKETLIAAFKNDIEAGKSRIISLCNLTLLPNEKVTADNIGEKENFDTLKANGIKFKKVELFSRLSSRIVLGRVEKDYNDKSLNPYQRLSDVILSDGEVTTKWLRACCCYMAFLIDKKRFADVFKKAREDKTQIVRETAIYALNNSD